MNLHRARVRQQNERRMLTENLQARLSAPELARFMRLPMMTAVCSRAIRSSARKCRTATLVTLTVGNSLVFLSRAGPLLLLAGFIADMWMQMRRGYFVKR